MSRTLRPLAALAIVALIGAGCSNGSAENGNTGTASSTGTTSSGANKKLTARDKAVKFAECIRAHGVSDFVPRQRNVSEMSAKCQRTMLSCAAWQTATQEWSTECLTSVGARSASPWC